MKLKRGGEVGVGAEWIPHPQLRGARVEDC